MQGSDKFSWQDDKSKIERLDRQKESRTRRYIERWLTYQFRRIGFGALATWMDLQASLVLTKAWLHGLFTKGLEGAWRERAGLQI
jgi:aarF domain-containing kinase